MAGDEALVMTSLVLIMAIFLRKRRTFFQRMRLMALQTRRMQRNAVMLTVNRWKRGSGLELSAILNHEAN